MSIMHCWAKCFDHSLERGVKEEENFIFRVTGFELLKALFEGSK